MQNISFLDTESGTKITESSINQLVVKNFKKEPNKVIEIGQEILNQLKQKGSETVRPLAEKFISLCVKNKINSAQVNVLDRYLHGQDHAFQIAENKANFARWQKWGFNPQVLIEHYDVAKYLLESPLGNQMKIFEDPIIMNNDKPGILVEGKWASFEDIMNHFEIKFLPEYKEKFMVHKESGTVYTFLGNGGGLQKHNPYTAETLDHPITRLTEEEFERTLAVAQKFVREGETIPDPKRTFVFQIVSSYVTDSQNNNAMELLYRKKHPWIRVICGRDNEEYGTKKGDVFEIGFGWSSPSKLPAKTTKGRFRTEDLWNYNTKAKKRVVTNIAITPEEAQGMFKYIMEFHKHNIRPGKKDDKIAFNLWSQNCSAFVHYIAKQANIKVPTKIFLTDLIKRISPDWIKLVGRNIKAAALAVKSDVKLIASLLPGLVTDPLVWASRTIQNMGLTIGSFVVSKPVEAISVAVGGAAGDSGRAFTDNAQEKKVLGPRLTATKNFFSLKRFFYHLPGILQEWQLEQKEATVVYQNPVKLSVVPPLA